jgi:hypothetical protein
MGRGQTRPIVQGGPLFDPTPVLALFPPGTPAGAIADRVGASVAAVQRWRAGQRRMRPVSADTAATRLGYHPTQLWPDWDRVQETCGRGHPWPENEVRFGDGYRRCRACRAGS